MMARFFPPVVFSRWLEKQGVNVLFSLRGTSPWIPGNNVVDRYTEVFIRWYLAKKSEHSNEAESQWSSGCRNFDSSQEHSGLFRFSPSHHRNIESLTITIVSTLNIKVSGSPDSCHVTVIVYNVKMADRWVTLGRKKWDSILGTGHVVKNNLLTENIARSNCGCLRSLGGKSYSPMTFWTQEKQYWLELNNFEH